METDDDGDLLILSLATGQVVIELLPEVAPLHVARVLELARPAPMTMSPFTG